ncbi:hypothetical protein [Helicobacter sp. T3_23-1056]
MRKVLKYGLMALCVFGIVGCGDNVESNEKNIGQKALKSLEKLCDDGDSGVCLELAGKNNYDEQKALEYYEKGCNGKPAGENIAIGESCIATADIYARKLEGDKALPYYIKACEIGGNCSERLRELNPSGYLQAQSKACTSLNNNKACWIYDPYMSDDKGWNLEAITKSCENGASAACRAVYFFINEQAYAIRAVELDLGEYSSVMDRAEQYGKEFYKPLYIALHPVVEQHCKNGNIGACQKMLDYEKKFNDDERIEMAEAIENSKNIATKQLDTLCQTNKSECKWWHEEQIKTQTNDREEMLSQLCEKGYGGSCSLLGDIYAEKLDGKQAIAYYKKGCENGSDCDKLWDTQKDEKVRDKEIIPFFKKLCENGNKQVCNKLGTFYLDLDDIKQSVAFYEKGGATYGVFYRILYQNKDKDKEAYWLGYHRGDSKKARESLNRVIRTKNEIRSELLKLCQTQGNHCGLLWSIAND